MFYFFFLQRAFDALCHSSHLYGRRLVLEWAESEESIDELRKKTAEHFSEGESIQPWKQSVSLKSFFKLNCEQIKLRNDQ